MSVRHLLLSLALFALPAHASGADTAEQSLTSWVVVAVAGAILTVLGFLVRNAFENMTLSLKDLTAKLDTMGATIAKSDGDRRVLETEQRALKERVDKLEREVRELSEGVAR